MCQSSMNMSVRADVDGPTYLPSAVARAPHWPRFVIGRGGPEHGHDFYVRRPGPISSRDQVSRVLREAAAGEVDGFTDCPLEVGAFVAAATEWAEGTVELRQYQQLARVLDLATEIAMDMLAAHPRLCGCPLCVLLAAHDDRQPGFRQTVWASVTELPAVISPIRRMLADRIGMGGVSTAKAIRLTEGRLSDDVAEHLSYSAHRPAGQRVPRATCNL
ncbi:hypothetical protein [Limnoglobus roseus]|uniref:Uncharacterized protein n=1 Tax=Limnoglobus roseus TaxID=2598579 RepID=A0A5C1AJH8_9BACT|nr:hypothetical protein [Limnoglobus roseus]QEL18327.1 hypothetical protein PX52LOC_05348 [Limnoglobus roseus]